MHAQEVSSTLPADTVKAYTLKLAPLLIRAGFNVAVRSDGIVEVRNPRDARMTQPIMLAEHQSALWWAWVWSGPTREAPPERELMVPVDDVGEAARRIANVLRVAEPAGAEQ
ncbi:hypothetical protein [Actinoallomurus sp. CA-150999]|uniref:hypothetical protein n=1 Tax=Actinoallomurus sp. CA-150999 TaxID=3239887 RepID=UPI003D8FDC23